MTVWICKACGVEYPESEAPPTQCRICSDERQYVPRSGQAWTTLAELAAVGTRIVIAEEEPQLYAVTASPPVGIGQRSLLLQTDAGNILWDPVGYVDEAGAAAVLALGPVVAIVASHPHMYGVQVEWSRALGGVPVLVAAADAEWVQRSDDSITVMGAADTELVPGVTLRTLGGHFPGSFVLHWAAGAEGRGVMFAGDTFFPLQDGKWVGFLRSYPNMLPLSGAVVDRVATEALASRFDRVYGNLGGSIPLDGAAVVRRSADRHIAWVRGDFDHLT